YRGGFWVIENLEYLDNVYGRRFQDLMKELAGQPLKVYEPTEYGRPGQEQATFTIALEDGIQYLENNYIPLISILAEPRTFMALVPADKAFEVMQAIKTKYEREMGRVRNRLPLHLGVVFADSHHPLRTILDAGRRMLQQQTPGLLWRVVGEEEKRKAAKAGMVIKYATATDLSEAKLEEERPDLIYRKPEQKQERITDQFKQWHRIVLLSEERFRRCVITWYVPAVMGDGQTEDHWYPYVFLADCGEPSGRLDKRYYLARNPWNTSHSWLIHAAALQPGDRIYFTPATFDFIFLDHGGRRFEIAYDEQGHRRGTLHRPYLLDEIVELEACWERLKQGLHSRQIHQIRDLIETKRREWFDNPRDSFYDPTFREFCRSVLVNAEWRENHHPEKRGDTQRLTQWAVSGLLADAVELFYHIMKQRPVGEADEDTGNAAI
ncbi:MAG: hypothetical protein GXO55_04315, partial [Chloroflexi bacterium]|nr:hypothetical protein [Chloroflexota bacterium]